MTRYPVSNRDGAFVMIDRDVAEWLTRMRYRVTIPERRKIGNCRPRVCIKDPKSGTWTNKNLSRVVANPPRRLYVQHLNGDLLDCRRENLRLTGSKAVAGAGRSEYVPLFMPEPSDRHERYPEAVLDKIIFGERHRT